MGLSGTLLTCVEIIRSKPVKIAYKCAKGICLGAPAIKHCAKELVECYIEIDTKKIAGEACKRTLICLLPFGSIAGVSFLTTVIQHPAAESIAKFGGNAAGLIITGPAYGADRVLGPLEVLIFGETIPLVNQHRLFLFDKILSE